METNGGLGFLFLAILLGRSDATGAEAVSQAAIVFLVILIIVLLVVIVAMIICLAVCVFYYVYAIFSL